MNILAEIIKIAEIHAYRIDFALKGLEQRLPFDANKLQSLTEHEFLLTELLVNRFSKLQDLIGTKIIDAFLTIKEEMIENLTMIDKLNKLERFGIIDHVATWRKMREVRNHLAHEYPSIPEITADYLNQLVMLSQELLKILKTIKEKSL